MSYRYQLEGQLVEYSHLLHEKGWVANHDGNLTTRLADGDILATPTAESKRLMERSWLIKVNLDGKVVSGRRKVFSEISLHNHIYRTRPDALAVIHSHAPNATALAILGIAVEPRMMPEPVVSLGDKIPLVAYGKPKTAAFTQNLTPALLDSACHAVTLQNHGVLTWGADLETAFLRMELVEHLAMIQLKVMQVLPHLSAQAVSQIPIVT